MSQKPIKANPDVVQRMQGVINNLQRRSGFQRRAIAQLTDALRMARESLAACNMPTTRADAALGAAEAALVEIPEPMDWVKTEDGVEPLYKAEQFVAFADEI